jgi:uncharacterized protein (DUF1015 family)
MAKIIPFKAVRPSSDKVGLVTCRTYDDYNAGELAALLNYNPYSFLHVMHPAFANSQKISTEKRFKSVAHKYDDFKNEDVLIREENPVFYLYEIQTKTNVFSGIIAGTSVEDYNKNVIKKHEDTLQFRVEMIKDFMKYTDFNAEPVLITYPDSTEINTFISIRKNSKPLYEFATTAKEKHTLWKIDTQTEIDWLQNHFENIPNLYIADGHHRSASAALLHEQNTNLDNKNLNYFMSFLIAESNVKIYEFNRIIRDLNGFTKDAFLQKISKIFTVINKNQELYKPQNKYEFGMYIDGDFYALFYKTNADLNFKSFGIENLDAQILYDTVLHPLLGIGDLRNDERIDYVSGKLSVSVIKELIDEGEFEVGFMLFPSNINEIKALADQNLIMPPKSTYIEPKFRCGLVVYEL